MSTRPVRPTTIGVTVAAAIVSVAVIGWALDYAAFRIIAVAGLAAWSAAALTARRVPDLDLERELAPTRVERGRPARAVVMVVNRRVRRAAATAVSQTVGDDRVERQVPALAEGRSVIVSADLPTNRRGAIPVGPLELARTDPAGLWRSSIVIDRPVTLLVQPRIHAIDPRPGGRLRHLDGVSNDRADDGTITFQSLREYVPGDDVRRVHWRSTARTGTLMVREHVDASLPSTTVVLDTGREAYDGPDDFESAVDVAASLIDSSRRAGHLARLITSGGVVMTLRAGHHGQDIADFLASVQADRAAELGLAAEAVRRTRERDAIVTVTGEVDAGALDVVTRSSRGFTTAVLVSIREESPQQLRWPSGLHLSGVDADAALTRWRVGTPAARSEVGA